MMRSCGGSGRRRGLRVGTVSLALLALAGCSVPDALNPVSWYRDLSGVSKNDALDNTPKNKQNLEAGSKEPYPNLADVPDAPSNALSAIDRDKLQQSLVADRENAKYSADALRAGTAAAGIVPSPPPPAPAAIALPQRAVPGAPQAAAAPKPAAAAAPQSTAPNESSLTSPAIPDVPTGETPPPPPPPPKLPPAPVAVAPIPPPETRTASLGSGERRAAPASSQELGAVSFADGSAALSDADRTRLSEIAALHHRQGGAIRVIGHAKPIAAQEAMQQQLDSFTLALSRARAVAQELGAEGVPANAIEVEAAPSRADDAAASSAEIFLEH